MKTIYTYYFNNDGVFTCTIANQKKTFQLKEDKTIESLQLLDTISFDKIQVFSRSIRLYKENSEIHLRDLDLFIEKELDQYIPKLYKKIEKSLNDYLHQEAKKRKKQNKSINSAKKIFKITMGATLMATLLSGMNLKSENGKLSESVSTEANLLHQENTLGQKPIFSKFLENMPDFEAKLSKTQNIVETMEKSLEEGNLNITQNQETIVYLNYEKTNDLVKKEYTFSEYKELTNWCSEKWGISSNLILMLLTQESAGKETNLMQIEWGEWAGKPIRAYNFRDNQYETFLLTNYPTEEEKAKYTCITEEDLKNPKTNISIGCVLLRKSAEAMDYHIMASLQCYNLGIGNMDKIFNKIKEETGQTKEEILSNQSNLSFYEYTQLPRKGDPNYLSNVFGTIKV